MNSMRQLTPVSVIDGNKKGILTYNSVAVDEIYLDGKLKKAQEIDEDEKSYGIFMHSLVLSNYAEVMSITSSRSDIIGDEYEKAIYHYASLKGFDKRLIESIAPKVGEMAIESDGNFKVSSHLINEKVRIVSKGTPEKLLRRCSYILLDSKFVKLTRNIYKEVSGVLFEMLLRCRNVYAIAIKDISQKSFTSSPENCANGMTLVAFVGLGSNN